MNEPLVSILTPCYNVEKWIDRYMTKFLNQTYNNVELVIVNDGSTDSSEEKILSYTEKFKERGYKLKYVYQENRGLGGAVNKALKLMSGEYFAWCDSDNFYTDDYIEEKVRFFLANPQYSVVRCDGFIVEDGTFKEKGLMSNGNNDKFNENLFDYCIFEKNFHFGCAMLRTSDFDKVNPQREIYESREGQNWQLLLPMFYNYKSGYIDKPMFYFVVRSDSISHCKTNIEDLIEQYEEHKNILSRVIKTLNIPNEEEYLKKIHFKYLRIYIEIARMDKDKKMISKYYKEFMYSEESLQLKLREFIIYHGTLHRMLMPILKVRRSLCRK